MSSIEEIRGKLLESLGVLEPRRAGKSDTLSALYKYEIAIRADTLRDAAENLPQPTNYPECSDSCHRADSISLQSMAERLEREASND